MTSPNPSELIDLLGGTAAVARRFAIAMPSVSNWRTNGIPDDKLIRMAPDLEKVSDWRRWHLFPKDWHAIWPELVGTPGAPVAPQQGQPERCRAAA